MLGALPWSVAACAAEARVTVVVDTTGSGGTLEVLALPVDPATIELPVEIIASSAGIGTPRADSIARFVATRDSAAMLDARFQRERTALNSEAGRFAALDRSSTEYARAWDAHRSRLVEAERLRTTRDRLRERVASIAARLGDAAPPDDSTRRAAANAARRQALDAASDGQRSAERAPVRAGTAMLTLDAGRWWLGTSWRGEPPATFTRVDVEAGARDTIRLRR